MTKEEVIVIAKVARKAAEDLVILDIQNAFRDQVYENVYGTDLGGACGDMAAVMCKLTKGTLKLQVGDYDGENGGFHCWNAFKDGTILDTTATQFNKKLKPVYVVYKNQPSFKKYAIDPLIRTERACWRDLRKWQDKNFQRDVIKEVHRRMRTYLDAR